MAVIIWVTMCLGLAYFAAIPIIAVTYYLLGYTRDEILDVIEDLTGLELG